MAGKGSATGSKSSRGSALREDWLTLADKVGGVQALADVLGVHYYSIYRWGALNKPMHRMAIVAVGDVALRVGVPNPAENNPKQVGRVPAKKKAKKRKPKKKAR